MRTRVQPIIFLLAALALGGLSTAAAGQRRGAEPETNPALDAMSIAELRTYQGYFYASGGDRDPLTMRRPSNEELGHTTASGGVGIPLEEQRLRLEQTLLAITTCLRNHEYDEAMQLAEDILTTVENEWPAIRPEHVDMLRMVDEIRNYNRLAVGLKRNQDIQKEFQSLSLRVDGVTWSPTDAKTVVNGRTYSAGEVMLSERRQGDLRIELIEERGVIFQFRGMRFRLPVDLYAPMGVSLGP